MRAAKVWEGGGWVGGGKDSRLIIQYGQMGLRQLTDGILNRTALLHIWTRHLQDCFQHTSAPNQHLHTKGITPHSEEGGKEDMGRERKADMCMATGTQSATDSDPHHSSTPCYNQRRRRETMPVAQRQRRFKTFSLVSKRNKALGK